MRSACSGCYWQEVSYSCDRAFRRIEGLADPTAQRRVHGALPHVLRCAHAHLAAACVPCLEVVHRRARDERRDLAAVRSVAAARLGGHARRGHGLCARLGGASHGARRDRGRAAGDGGVGGASDLGGLVMEIKQAVPRRRFDTLVLGAGGGGQSQNFGGDQAARTCAAADRTGHAILHSLYQQNIRAKTHFFDEFYAIDLIKDDDGYILGAVVLEIETGEPLVSEAKTTLIATGGVGRIFRTNTNARINTGDGMGMVLRAGIPLEDMEFFQFHPTGFAGKGMLISEAVRGEGGYLINKDGERFMERYAPKAKDLASRDVVSRAIATEVREGRGCGPDGEYILL